MTVPGACTTIATSVRAGRREPPRATSLFELAVRRLVRTPSGIFGLCVLSLLVLAAVFAPLIASHDPIAQVGVSVGGVDSVAEIAL